MYGKAKTFAERKARRGADIVGMKETLSILSGGESLLKQKSSKNFLRRTLSCAIP